MNKAGINRVGNGIYLERVLQTFHIAREVGTDGRATGKKEICHHNSTAQIVQRNLFTQLVGQGNIFELSPYGVCNPFAINHGVDDAFGKIMARHMHRIIAKSSYNEVTDERQQNGDTKGFDCFLTHGHEFAGQRYTTKACERRFISNPVRFTANITQRRKSLQGA